MLTECLTSLLAFGAATVQLGSNDTNEFENRGSELRIAIPG